MQNLETKNEMSLEREEEFLKKFIRIFYGMVINYAVKDSQRGKEGTSEKAENTGRYF